MNAQPPRLWGYVPVRGGGKPDKAAHIKPEIIALGAVEGVINKRVNASVRYAHEECDQWTGASDTLKRGFGDCEDIAIVKQAGLRAIGIQSWLLIVHDKIARRQHTVCLTDDLILDLHAARALPIASVSDYRPIMAVGDDCSWFYGKTP